MLRVLVLLKRKMVIEDETEFCNEELLLNVLRCKVSPLSWRGIEVLWKQVK